jgi:uncharacterized damage-inducible protein DinB
MKDFYLDKFQYSFEINQKVIDYLLSVKENLNDKILTHINHTINAHEIWNSRIFGNQNKFDVWQLHDSKDWSNLLTENAEASKKIIESIDLKLIIEYTTSKGELFSSSVEDILYHILNHTNYHIAQINTALRILGLQPISTDYIFYTRSK